MDAKEYQKLSVSTEQNDYNRVQQRMSVLGVLRLDHAAKGLATEAGEFTDQLKKHVIYGKPLDTVNLMEEVGDILWYCSIALDEIGHTFEDAMEANIAKLEKRYGEKFSGPAALNRDEAAERAVLVEKLANKGVIQ